MTQHEKIRQLFDTLWRPYLRDNPQVNAILSLIRPREAEENIVNDHIAFRTFNHPAVNLRVFAKTFVELGFEERDRYELPEKQVVANYYKHPSGQWPRVFISELLTEKLSVMARKIIDQLIASASNKLSGNLCEAGRPWSVSFEDYQRLLQESEYAAWLAALGFRMNHATISINHLKSFAHIEDFIQFLQHHGFVFNGEKAGKILQIAKDQVGNIVLKQASTLADKVTIDFSDQQHKIPNCYFEFIERFQHYDGFDPGNATKIMESTEAKKG